MLLQTRGSEGIAGTSLRVLPLEEEEYLLIESLALVFHILFLFYLFLLMMMIMMMLKLKIKSDPKNSQDLFCELIGFFWLVISRSEDGGWMRKAYYHVNFFTLISFLLFPFLFFLLYIVFSLFTSNSHPLYGHRPLYPASHFPSLFSVLMPNFVFVCFCFASFCFQS